MTTAHCVEGGGGGGARGGGGGGGGGGGAGAASGATGLGRSRITVRTSCRAVPSGSSAVITMAFGPSRSVSGALTATDFCGLRSSCWWTSVPWRETVMRLTPLLDRATAATTLASSATRERSSG